VSVILLKKTARVFLNLHAIIIKTKQNLYTLKNMKITVKKVKHKSMSSHYCTV